MKHSLRNIWLYENVQHLMFPFKMAEGLNCRKYKANDNNQVKEVSNIEDIKVLTKL